MLRKGHKRTDTQRRRGDTHLVGGTGELLILAQLTAAGELDLQLVQGLPLAREVAEAGLGQVPGPVAGLLPLHGAEGLQVAEGGAAWREVFQLVEGELAGAAHPPARGSSPSGLQGDRLGLPMDQYGESLL